MRRLNESVWGGMLDRSVGDIVRKEDDVNHMDFDTFADYIEDNYSENGDWFAVREGEDGKSRSIEIDIIYRKEIDLSFNVVDGELYNILVQGNKNYVDIPGLKEIFNVNIIGSSTFSVYEKNWTISNNTFVKLIEFYLNKKTNESVWGGMLNRSVGDTIRKEDGINLLDGEGLYEYIKEHYNIHSGAYIDYDDSLDTLSIPLFAYDTSTIKFNEQTIYYGILDDVIYVSGKDLHPELKKILEDNYNLVKDADERFDDYFYNIHPKDNSKINNALFISIIDYVLEQIKKISVVPLMKKKDKVNESVWGGMLNRSVGDSIRKEDKLPGNFSEIKYIDTGDENILWSDRNFVVDDQETFEKDEIVFPKGYRYPTEKEVDTLTGSWSGCTQKNEDGNIHIKDIVLPQGHYFVVEEGRRIEISKSLAGTSIIFCCAGDIEPKSNRQYKIRLVKEKNMNESVWGGMLNRSVGDSVRKEDDIELLDMVGLYEYILSHYELTDNRFEMTYGTANMSITISNNGDEILLTYKTEEVHCYFYLAKYSKLYSELSKKFYIETAEDCKHYIISPKGEFTNQFFIDVLDCIIENRQTILRKKVVNESVWGSMLNRSVGDTKRKEDEIPKDLQEALAAYIDMFASNAFSGDYTVGSYPDFRAFVKDFMNSPRIMKLDFDMGDLLQYIEDHWNDVVLPTILKTIDEYNKSIDVTVDTIIDSLKNPEVNESVWGGMLDRSVGDSVRKEDDLTPDDVKYHIKEFVGRIVYYEQYENTVNDYERFSKERWRFYDDKSKAYTEKHIDYVKRNWENGAKFRIVIENLIKEEEEKIKKLGFEKEPGKSVDETLNDWWDSVDDKRDFMDDCDEECYTNPDDMWEDRDWDEKIKMYVDDKNYMGESVWGGMLKRSTGDEKRKEDYLNNLDRDGFYEYLTGRYQPMFVNNKIEKSRYSIMIPMFLGRHVSQLSIFDSDDNRRSVSLSIHKDDMYDHYGDFKKELELKYKLDFSYVEKGWWEIGITSKDDKIDITLNSSIVELIDYILDTDKQYTNMIERTVTESVWGGLLNRSVGDENRKEDGITQTDMDAIVDSMNEFATRVVWDNEKFSMEKFCKCVRDYLKSNKDINIENIIKYIYNHWTGDIEKDIEGFIEEEEKEKENGMNESVWGGMLSRSAGDTVRKEDEVLTDMEINSLNEFTLMYCREERAHYIQNHIVPPPPSGRKENDYEGLIKYIEDRRDENRSTNVGDYNKIIEYIKKNWDTLDMDTYIKKWICTPSVMNGKKIVECEGVPGGATPANVGGMGAAYFPGPNGEPGSGDLPSPTGIVYHQVAPYTVFLKELKKKKKKKKFRIEDEPCAHSKNSKVYDYVDDYREYVDRTYNNMDKRK